MLFLKKKIEKHWETELFDFLEKISDFAVIYISSESEELV